MRKWIRPATLHLQPPLGSTLGLSILLLVLLFGLTETTLRLLVRSHIIPAPYLGTYNAELDIKIRMLDRLVAQTGAIDCIFLGSSQFDNAVDPQVFNHAYQQLSGKSISCFNFSLQTLTASPAGLIADILVWRYRPSLIIFGTSARDYSTNFGEAARPLLEDPWVRYSHGDFNLKGWLIEHSYSIRLPVSFYRRFSREYHDHLVLLAASLTPLGNTPVEDSDLSNPKTNFIPEYVISSHDLAGLQQLAHINASGTQVIVVEVPVHHSFLPFYIEADAQKYRTLFIDPVSDYLAALSLPFWHSEEPMHSLIPDNAWADVKHLNTIGAEVFSRWLAERLHAAVTSHEIPNPFQ